MFRNLPVNSANLSTLLDLLNYRSVHQPNQNAYTFLEDGEAESGNLTYYELNRQAKAIAASLQLMGATGERALLLYPSGLDFIAAFFGCLYAGVVAIPAYPPKNKYNQNMSRLQAIVADAQAKFVLTTVALLDNISEQFAQHSELTALRFLATDDIDSNQAQLWQAPELFSSTLAFLQYTSGSTGTPKGVMVSHGNVLHNQQMIQQAFGHSDKTVVVGWLPLFHDMGLIGNVIQPLYLGTPCILMPATAFLQKPFRWLAAISRYKATTSGAPNFAYELCVRKITPEQKETLDLSSWELAFNGAEPVRIETQQQFAQTFASCGFSQEAFYPCYGMAETTLFVSGGLKTAIPVVCSLDSHAIKQNTVVITNQQEKSQRVISCGWGRLDQKIVIVNHENLTVCLPGQVGEIWVSGANVAQGYWHQPDETKKTFHAYISDTGEGPFLRTGDLGFLHNAELFVTGRLKDLIIIRGCNYYPQDIEQTLEQSHMALQPGSSAAFSLDVEGVEKLVVICEVQRTYLRNLIVDEVVEAIRKAISEQYELQVYAVLLLKPGSIPKTTSGKIQRLVCKAEFIANKLPVIASSILYPKDDLNTLTEAYDDSIQKTSSNTTPAESQSSLEIQLREQIAQILKIDKNQIKLQQPLHTLGIDSLQAMEIRNYIDTQFGLSLEVDTFLDSISILQIATKILSETTYNSTKTLEQKLLIENLAYEKVENLLNNIDNFSDMDVELLLNKFLNEKE